MKTIAEKIDKLEDRLKETNIELDKLFSGNSLPDDIHLFIRTKYDIPPKYEDSVYDKLKEMGWKPVWIPDPTLINNHK